jgi:transglutaminase-like putative cysteine protease
MARISRRVVLWRRLRNTVRTIFARGDFTALIIACLLMLIPVLALNTSLGFSEGFQEMSAEWQVDLNQLIPVAVLSVIFGFLLARSHYSELFSLFLSGIYAIGTIVSIQIANAPGNIFDRIVAVASRFMSAVNGGLINGEALDPYLLILFLSILVWFLGHNTAWHTFRLDRVWRAILPPGIVLVLNSFYNTTREMNLDFYLVVYLFLALLLVVRSHIEAREFDWYMNRVRFTGTLRNWFFRAGAVIGVILLAFAWLLPTGNAEENQKRFQDFLNGETVQRVMEVLNKLFASVEGEGVATADYYGGERLTLGGAIQLSEQPVMAVQAPREHRYYWKSRIFDTYGNSQWTTTRTAAIDSDSQLAYVIQHPREDLTRRVEVEQQFLMIMGSRLVYTAPQPSAVRLPVRIEYNEIPGTLAQDPAVLRPLNPLARGDVYSTVSLMSVADADYLRTLPPAYPPYITNRYLQLPANFDTRVRDLAYTVAGNMPTTYDQAKAVERWLRENITYNEAPAPPPIGVDMVSHVLFTNREGYCTYYASAMILMLRSMGIPARMAAGFAQGIWDPATGSYLVRERDAHTWVEVYFPNAGWIEFEPTSAQEPVDRPDQQSIQPTSTPSPTPTLTPTFTPSPTPDSTEAAIPPANATQPQPDMITPTPTFTPSPTPSSTPTATPLPPPPSFLQVPPPVQSFFNSLLLIAALITAVSFGAVFMLWWVEYRGLDRLNAIERAYARLAIYAGWLKIPITDATTPLERGRRIAREVPQSGRPTITITDAYITERYAPPDQEPDMAEVKKTEESWRRARRAFIDRIVGRFFRRT